MEKILSKLGYIKREKAVAEIKYLLSHEFKMSVLSFSKMEKCRVIGRTEFGSLILMRVFQFDSEELERLRESNEKRAESNLWDYKAH